MGPIPDDEGPLFDRFEDALEGLEIFSWNGIILTPLG
jgi:hypothetical protein